VPRVSPCHLILAEGAIAARGAVTWSCACGVLLQLATTAPPVFYTAAAAGGASASPDDLQRSIAAAVEQRNWLHALAQVRAVHASRVDLPRCCRCRGRRPSLFLSLPRGVIVTVGATAMPRCRVQMSHLQAAFPGVYAPSGMPQLLHSVVIPGIAAQLPVPLGRSAGVGVCTPDAGSRRLSRNARVPVVLRSQSNDVEFADAVLDDYDVVSRLFHEIRVCSMRSLRLFAVPLLVKRHVPACAQVAGGAEVEAVLQLRQRWCDLTFAALRRLVRSYGTAEAARWMTQRGRVA
jgi:hypothetical protein